MLAGGLERPIVGATKIIDKQLEGLCEEVTCIGVAQGFEAHRLAAHEPTLAGIAWRSGQPAERTKPSRIVGMGNSGPAWLAGTRGGA